MLNFKVGILIPCYNHGQKLKSTLERLQYLALPILVVDDGSRTEDKALIQEACNSFPDVTLLELEKNSGKGAAVTKGAKYAENLGWTHFLQIDADGQHEASDAVKLIELGRRHPNDLISGSPVFDESIPKSRLFCRYLTHVWVYIETRSLDIEDSFCGFRLYPLRTFLEISEEEHVGSRMDFDIEIMVRFYWRTGAVRFVKTRVVYPKDGSSNFDLLADNWRITKMHTRLFLESLGRLAQKIFPKKPHHWAAIKERRGLGGMKFLIWAYRTGGRDVFRVLLAPVIFFFWLTGKEQRSASRKFLTLAAAERKKHRLPPRSFSSLRHFFTFGECVLDKISAWSEDWTRGKEFEIIDSSSEALLSWNPNERGRLVLVSHLGMAESCRAVAQKEKGLVINALVFDQNAQRIRSVMNTVNRNSSVNLIAVQDISMETVIDLEERISRGEWVAIAADRVPVSNKAERTAEVTFFGKKAQLPVGPYVLGSLLKCPVMTLFAVREKGKIWVQAEHFANFIDLPKKGREEAVARYAQQYAALLEAKAVAHPMNWFNFYDFWAPAAAGEVNP